MGIRLVEALNLVSRWSEGALADELRKVRNDIAWNEDVERALLEFANRLRVPQVTRTMKLIAKGNRSSSNLSQIISIAAEDTRNRYQIERKRRSEMGAYTAIVVIGFLVFLAVIVMLDTSYLTPISNLSGTTGEVGGEAAPGGVAGVASVGDVPVGVYRAVFLHSALIQGIGSGLLAGKLAENNVLAGLKYSIGLVTITAIVFLVI
jgi:flagellar protein FlaJ